MFSLLSDRSFQKRVSIHCALPEGGSTFDGDVLADSEAASPWPAPVLSDFDGSSPALLPALQGTPHQAVARARHSPASPSFKNPFSPSNLQGFITFPLDQHFTKMGLQVF